MSRVERAVERAARLVPSVLHDAVQLVAERARFGRPFARRITRRVRGQEW